ncbi:ATP-binding cassette domain-containing protein [Actinomyces vulturis]|uniref:ATP-binding cassette domain-containing protein n=1 Tax=Actinomyces vulturis TaxID=1857645 RepID=UPI0009F216D7|nr:ATP-binding cassette domain-containing protein [Actinomyces vulturis]
MTLIVRSLSGHGPAQPLSFTQAFTVGRTPESGFQVSHPLVSRRHLVITPTAQGWKVICEGRNGMMVNGFPMSDVLVTDGMRIQLGDASGPVIALTPAAAHADVTSGTGHQAPPSAASAQGTIPSGSVPADAHSRHAAPSQPSTYSAPSPGQHAVGTPQSGQAQQAGYQQQAPYSGYQQAPQGGYQQAPQGGAPAGGPSVHPSIPSGQAATTAMRINPQTGAPEVAGNSPVAMANSAQAPRMATVEAFRITSSGTIGRAPDNALVIDDPLISKHHARIDLTPQGITVTDLGSTNGIYLGRDRVPHVLVTQPVMIGMGSSFVAISPDGLCQVQVAAGNGGELVAKDLRFEVKASGGGNLRLLDDISFSLPGNELLAVVGPSGAGKSTLLKALTGEQKAQHGQVLFDGLDVYEHYPVMRNKIGVVPQNDVIHSALTVSQTMNYAAELRFPKDVTKAEREARIREVLEDLDLTDHINKPVKKLSGGQRKRVSTAIELLTRPSLLFLDEPTSGLDPQLDRDVMDLLATLAHGTRPGDSGRTVMVVTHNENHIDRADKVLILAAGGKPVYFGAPTGVLPYFRERLAEFAARGELVLQAQGHGILPDPPAVDGYADVYALIRNHTEPLRAHLEATVPSTRRGSSSGPKQPSAPTPKTRPQQSGARQMSTLIRRQMRIIAADRSYLAFMLLLPVIMGLLTKAIEAKYGYSIPPIVAPTAENPCPRPSSASLSLLIILITGSAFAGMSVTIRELIGERDVFLREKAVGLRTGSYLMSKVIILAMITAIQSALMVAIALLVHEGPTSAVFMSSPGLELWVACWLTAFSSGVVGLAISAFVNSSEQVMPILVVTIMAQLVLCGGIIQIAGRAGFEQAAWFMPARWGYALAASTVDVTEILPWRDDALWHHNTTQWLTDAGFLGLVTLGAFIICYMRLRARGRR